MELLAPPDTGTAVGVPVDADGDHKATNNTATPTHFLKHHPEINGVLNSTDQPLFPKPLVEETGRLKDAENVSRLEQLLTLQDSTRILQLFLRVPTIAHQTILHAMDKLTLISLLQVSIIQALPIPTLVTTLNQVNQLCTPHKLALTG